MSCAKEKDPLEVIFEDYQKNSPGASIAIFRDGEIVLKRTFGMADIENGKAVTSQTNFRLASVSKQFTATAILLLERDNLIDLEWSLNKVFEDFPDYGKQIRIHHLLHHSSGIWDYEDFVPDGDLENQIRDKEVLEIVRSANELYFPAGEAYRYSNTGYALLALIVEKYSGLDFPTFLEQRIFQPLGMKNTLAYIKGANEVPERAFGYSRENSIWVQKDQSSTSAVLGDGGIYSNVVDLFLWDQALHSGTLLPLETIERSFSHSTLNDGSKINYGMGWHLKTTHGAKVVYHTGSSTSFRNVFYRIPDKRLSVLILTNRNEPEEEDMVDLAERVLGVFQGLK